MNGDVGPTPEEAATLAGLRERLDAARARIASRHDRHGGESQRGALRDEVQSVRDQLAELEREHAAALAKIRGEAEAEAAAIRGGVPLGAGR